MYTPKNFRKIPHSIEAKLRNLKSTSVIAASLHKLSRADIEVGKFACLGITFKDGELHYPKSIVPRSNKGKASKVNAKGEEIVRKDVIR